MASTTISILVMFICLLQYSGAMDKLAEQKEVLDKILSEKHINTIIRPPALNGSDGPVVSEINIFVRSVNEIDEVKMEYQIQLTFRQKWRDPRLAYQDKHFKHTPFVTLLNPQNIWTPDVFFHNEYDAHLHNILRPNILMRIFPDGEVFYSTRLSLKLKCLMDLSNYPFDTQTCSVVVASYGYRTDDLIFLWKPENPIAISKSVMGTARYAISRFFTEYCTSRTSTGEYACINLNLQFVREWGYYLTQVYIPLAFMVILSWIPFWLDHRQTTARVVIWIGTLLVMALVTTAIHSKLPQVSTTKAIDVWCGACYTFLFAVAIEFVVIAHVTFREEKNPSTTMDHTDTNGQDSKLGKVRKWLKNHPSIVHRIDVISRICFPLAFIAFNVIYWVSYGRSVPRLL